MLLQVLQKTEKEEIRPNAFYDTKIREYTTKNENNS
jgi:hypothetical protein